MAMHPCVMLIDEGTSALDEETQLQVPNGLYRLNTIAWMCTGNMHCTLPLGARVSVNAEGWGGQA